MEARRRALAVAAAAVLLAAAGCGASTPPTSTATPQHVAWQRVALPPDPRGTALVRALGHCGSGWYAAGAVVDQGKNNHPALWFSSDGHSWSAVSLKPVSVYGPQNILYSVACNGARVVAVGAAVGGAHGNPRTSTWYGPVGGTAATEAHASFETFGGPDAVGVGPVAAGPGGFLIVGGRVDANNAVGAAVWQSHDGSSFTLVDADPTLESGAAGVTELHGGFVNASTFLAVGAITPPHSAQAARDAEVWSSPNGVTWQRLGLASTPQDNILEQVVATGSGLLAVGTDGGGFGAWTASPTGTDWRKAGDFGIHLTSTAVPRTVGLVPADGGTAVYAAVFDGVSNRLWHGSDDGRSWRQVELPTGAVAAIAGSGSAVVIAMTAADGTSQLYVAPS